MMRFHYEVIDRHFKDRYYYIYGDTDSCIYQIFTEDIYEWMEGNSEHFDLTDDKILGKFKDELKGKCMESFCALNPKCYSYVKQSDEELQTKNKCKGGSKVVVKNEITHEDYKHTMRTGKELIRNVMSFKSIRQQVCTVVQPKRLLNSFYDKFQMQDECNNIPYGYIDGGKQ